MLNHSLMSINIDDVFFLYYNSLHLQICKNCYEKVEVAFSCAYFNKSSWTLLPSTRSFFSTISLTNDFQNCFVLESEGTTFSPSVQNLVLRKIPKDALRGNTLRKTLFLSREGILAPHGTQQRSLWVWARGWPYLSAFSFQLQWISGPAATGKHILLEKRKSLTIDKKIHSPGNWW